MLSDQHLHQLTRFSDLAILKRIFMTTKDAASLNQLLTYNDPGKRWLSTDDFDRIYMERRNIATLQFDGLPLFDAL